MSTFVKRAGSVLSAFLLVVGLGACGDDGATPVGTTRATTATTATTVATVATTSTTAANTQIVTVDFKFEGLTVAANQPLTIVNRGQAPHTVTAVDGRFDVQVAAGATGQLAALPPGTYEIRCRFHASSQNMVGTLTVR